MKNEWVDEWMKESTAQTNKWMSGEMNEWMDEWIMN